MKVGAFALLLKNLPLGQVLEHRTSVGAEAAEIGTVGYGDRAGDALDRAAGGG